MIKFGNHKLGDDTAIFNMGTATDCPSKKLGLCDVTNSGIKCYAYKAEIQYPKTVPAARSKQGKYWRDTPVDAIIFKFKQKIDRRRKPTRFIRFNEASDFHGQEDIEKLSKIAEYFSVIGITTYGYSARSDLDFHNAKFLVKGSGNSKGNNGRTCVIGKKEKVPEGYIVCPGGEKGCSRCNLCKIDTKLNIAFRVH